MEVVGTARSTVRARPIAITAVLSVFGYALVLGGLYGDLPIFPPLSDATVDLFSHLIAGINTVALVALVLGYRFIRRGDVERHRLAMLSAFVLILLFLVFYLWKTGGGFEKTILATGPVRWAYLLMLAIHVALSMLAVPVVLYAVLLGLTHSPTELADTSHARIGRIAVAAWSLSLFLGIVTYFLLNHVYGWEKRHAVLLFALAVPALDRDRIRGRLP